MSKLALFENVAQRIRRAYEGVPIDPVGPEIGPLNLEGAYKVQQLNTAFRTRAGEAVVGRKIGLTSPVVQKQLGVDQPDYGVLFESMRVANGATIDRSKLLQPRIEGEIALAFRTDMRTAPTSLAELVDAVDWLSPALEIVDSRICNWQIGIVDTIADNASSGLFVIGNQRLRPREVDTVGCTMQLYANGEIVSQGTGAACLGDPYLAALWLVQKMIALNEPLKAGEVIMTGALGPMVTVHADTHYQLKVDGFGACDVTFS